MGDRLLCNGHGLGTLSGGWRIIKTLGTKIIDLQPINGFAAETSASIVLAAASYFGMPVSTTHIVVGSVFGVGIAKRLNEVRWPIAQRMVTAWVFTLPGGGPGRRSELLRHSTGGRQPSGRGDALGGVSFGLDLDGGREQGSMSTSELFERSPANPILSAGDMPFPCQAVCNPAACLMDGETLLLLRVIDNDEHSHLVVARSRDGISDWRMKDPPLLSPGHASGWYETLGCEDPRITYLADEDQYVITYVGASDQGAGVCLATTKDFLNVSQLGLIIHPYNKDAALFPRKIGGRYLLLHRPTAGPLENIWLSESEDLRHWGNPVCVLQEDQQPGWNSGKVGAGPTPIETPDGWLLIFHGVELEETGWLYRVGLALLDLDDSGRMIAKAPSWVFGPTQPYELRSDKPGIVFPTGAVVQDGTLRMYYGAADTTVAVASAKLEDLLGVLRANRI